MSSRAGREPQLYRIWISRYQDWQPGDWHEVPPRAIAIEPAEAGPLTTEQARAFLEGFNRAMLRARGHLWAVAVPVAVRYEGDAQSDQVVTGQQL
jgi:hypothetical protein